MAFRGPIFVIVFLAIAYRLISGEEEPHDWRDTVIGDHSKIDNLVRIGHNVVMGRSCMLCGQVGIAGSVTIGDYVTFGGRVAARDHVSIVSKVRLAATSCVTKDIKEPGESASLLLQFMSGEDKLLLNFGLCRRSLTTICMMIYDMRFWGSVLELTEGGK